MALSINPATKVITIPQADLTFVVGTLYELDTDVFRLAVNTLLSSEPYIWMETAYSHNTQVTVAGTTFARTLEFINGYSVEFENLTYSVRLAGSNNNIFDVENGILVQNLVQVIAQNSGGLIVGAGGGGGLTAQQTADAVWEAAEADYAGNLTEMGGKLLDGGINPVEVADAVWEAATADYADPLTMGGKILADLAAIIAAGGSLSPTQDLHLEEIWKILGLDITNPLIVSKILRTAGGAVRQAIEDNVPAAGSVKITRQ